MRYKDLHKTTLQILLAVGMLLAVLFPMLGQAGQMGKAGPMAGKYCLNVTTRPLSDFLNTQGTLNNPPQFFQPVPDYVGWTDGTFTTFALVDYTGLANKSIKTQTGQSLGTTVRGSVIQCALPEGRAQITVALFTTRALGFAQSIEAIIANKYDFLNTPTIFGAKAQDVVTGADAAVGPATLLTTFSISEPGAPLPDFLDVVNNPGQYAPVKLNFASTTFGKCSRLDVHEVASNSQNELVYSIEKVEVVNTKSGDCGG